LLADGRFEVILTWGPGQQESARKVLELARRSPAIAPETPSLKEYAWLIHRANAYFGGDTGPMHIAAAMGTPVVAVFGGTDPVQHAPYHSPCEVLAPATCPGKVLADAQKALRDISPEDAYDACVRLLAGRQSPA
jgi:lipopolysaccharide heptosyltransferase I